MKLSDFLLFPEERVRTGDGLEFTSFGNDHVDDPETLEFLNMLVGCTSINEARLIMMMISDQWSQGNLMLDVNEFNGVEES